MRSNGWVQRVRPGSSAILLVVSAILAAPLVFMVSIALSTDDTSRSRAFTLLPQEFAIGNFVRAFSGDLPIAQFVLNSAIIVVFACLGMVFSSALAAYGFARLRAPGSRVLFVVLLGTMMVPSEVLLIPQFIMFSKVGWVDTLLPLIVPNFFAGAYNVFLMRQFVTGIPREIDEAAKIDGLGYLGIFGRIVLPLMRPVLVAVTVFTFSFNWGNFLGPLIYINSRENMPLSLGIQLLSITGNPAEPPAVEHGDGGRRDPCAADADRLHPWPAPHLRGGAAGQQRGCEVAAAAQARWASVHRQVGEPARPCGVGQRRRGEPVQRDCLGGVLRVLGDLVLVHLDTQTGAVRDGVVATARLQLSAGDDIAERVRVHHVDRGLEVRHHRGHVQHRCQPDAELPVRMHA